MSNKPNPKSNPRKPRIYQIRIRGHLGSQWSDWLEGVTFTHESDGTTTLTGEIIDQAALYGLLKKIRDLGMPLLSFNRVDPSQVDVTDSNNKSAP